MRDLIALMLLAPFMGWLLKKAALAGLVMVAKTKHSFCIFLLHAPVLLLSYAVYKQLDQFIPYALYWFLAPILTTWSLIVLHNFCMNTQSLSFSWIFGVSTAKLA